MDISAPDVRLLDLNLNKTMKKWNHSLGKSKRELGIKTEKNKKIDKNYENPAYSKLLGERAKPNN